MSGFGLLVSAVALTTGTFGILVQGVLAVHDLITVVREGYQATELHQIVFSGFAPWLAGTMFYFAPVVFGLTFVRFGRWLGRLSLALWARRNPDPVLY